MYGNASSIHHFGQVAKQQLETARRKVAAKLGAKPREIVFTSGGTEANNLALRGMVKPGDHIITTAIEHPAVLRTAYALAKEVPGVEVTAIAPGTNGVVNPSEIRRALRRETALISVMHANNEIGTVQPLSEIAEIAREEGVRFHSDGVQAFGKIPANVQQLGVNLYALSGHKVGAPKGIGALYVREGTPLRAIASGGNQEGQRRAGTENVLGAITLGIAAETVDWSGVAALRDHLEMTLAARIPHISINGGGTERLPNTSNVCFEGVEGEAILIALDLKGFAVSSGSACSSGAVEPSHVLLAMGLTPKQARSSLRFSLGPTNTLAEVDALVEALVESVGRLRRISTDKLAYV